MEWEAHMVRLNYLTLNANIMNKAQTKNANSTATTMRNHSAATTSHTSDDDDDKRGANTGESSPTRAI